MIEVTFSDSFCGVLKMADYYSDCFGKDRSFISFMFFADVGNLSEGLFSEKRRCQVNQMHKHEYLFEGEFYTRYRWRKTKRAVLQLIADCEAGEHLRIWSGNQPSELCSTFALISLLRDAAGQVSVIHRESSAAYNKKKADSWGVLDPEDLAAFLPDEQFLDKNARREIAERYDKFCENSGNLRAFENGKLTPVPDEYYDSFILRQIPDGDFRLPQVISNVLRNEKTFIPFDFLQCRCAKILCSPKFERLGTIPPNPKMPHNGHRPPIYDMVFRRK